MSEQPPLDADTPPDRRVWCVSDQSGVVHRAVFSLGSNLGDRLATLQGAVDTLAATPGLDVVAVSSVYETDPVGGPEQPDYLNAVVVADTVLAPRVLLERAQAVEQGYGRTRPVRWGPRTLDVDVIAVGGLVVDEPDLQVPHPRAGERGFVLVPWCEADPDASLPGAGPVRQLLESVGRVGVRLRPDLVLEPPS